MAKAERTLSGVELAGRLKALPGWREEHGSIRRDYATEGWPATLMAANAIGFLAEAADHHPDLALSWSRITVRLNTHSAGGITDKDLELARRIEDLALWRPGAGSALTGTRRTFVQSGEA
jgi:4a-hydroxytetrahydrobiopterin dehydratase